MYLLALVQKIISEYQLWKKKHVARAERFQKLEFILKARSAGFQI